MASVVGTWSITTDWGCDSSITGTFSQTFNSDGTLSSGSHTGHWYQVGGYVVWTYDNVADLVYAANISGSWMAGAQGYETTGGQTGCFGAEIASLANTAPSARVKTDGPNPVLGR